MRKGARWLLFAAPVALGVVLTLAVRRHKSPSHCGTGWVNEGPRCCAVGQSLKDGSCIGAPKYCPSGFHRAIGKTPGCVIDAKRVRVGPIILRIGPNDWQSESVPRIDANVPAFEVDVAEVSYERWQHCVEATRCRSSLTGEPGQPITTVTSAEAQAFCKFTGGRLPTLNERMAMAAGAQSRRFPWGQTGLVCRRATFGVVAGPCAEKGNQPDVSGCHLDGQSPEGVLDLSGNVAELALDAEGKAWACGGSFRSRAALELKSWACIAFAGPLDDIGFRCAYDAIE